MSRIRTFLLMSAAIVVGACSDTQTATEPTTAPDASLSQKSVSTELKGVWGEVKAVAGAGQVGAEAAGPLLCNNSGRGPECLRIYRNGNLLQKVYHQGTAQGTGCSRSILKIAGVVRGRSGFACHVRGDRLFFTWFVNQRWSFGTRIQVDFTGAGRASPTGSVFTFFGR